MCYNKGFEELIFEAGTKSMKRTIQCSQKSPTMCETFTIFRIYTESVIHVMFSYYE